MYKWFFGPRESPPRNGVSIGSSWVAIVSKTSRTTLCHICSNSPHAALAFVSHANATASYKLQCYWPPFVSYGARWPVWALDTRLRMRTKTEPVWTDLDSFGQRRRESRKRLQRRGLRRDFHWRRSSKGRHNDSVVGWLKWPQRIPVLQWIGHLYLRRNRSDFEVSVSLKVVEQTGPYSPSMLMCPSGFRATGV